MNDKIYCMYADGKDECGEEEKKNLLYKALYILCLWLVLVYLYL